MISKYSLLFFSLCMFLLTRIDTGYAQNIRIVSLYSAYTEILTSIGAGSTIVGATRHDAKQLGIPSVGNHMNPSIEAVIACKPQFVIAFSRKPERFEKMSIYLKKAHIDFMVTAPETVEEVQKLIITLGRITKHEHAANQMVARIEDDFKSIEKALQNQSKKQPKIFIEVRQAPTLLTCGNNSIAADIVRRIGATLAVGGRKGVNRVNVEDILIAQPDFYVQQVGIMNKSPLSPDKERFISSLPCVKKGNFAQIDEKLISRPSVHIGKAAKKLYALVYTEIRE